MSNRFTLPLMPFPSRKAQLQATIADLTVKQEPNGRGQLSLFQEVGHTGLQQASGYIHEEFLRELSFDKAIKIYREMLDNSAILGAVLFAIDMMMRQVGRRVEVDTAEEDQEDERQVFVEENFTDMSHPFEDVVSEILSMIPYGWSYHELVYKRRSGPNFSNPGLGSQFDDGKIGWRKWPIRSQDTRERWEFDEDGGIQGMWQRPPLIGGLNTANFENVLIPIRKALLFRPRMHKNNPEGRSALRPAYRAYHFTKRIQEIEAIGIERDIAGFPFVRIPGALIKKGGADFNNWRRVVQRIKVDEQLGAVVPSDLWEGTDKPMYELGLLSTQGKRMIDTNEVLKRYELRMTQALLADFIMLGQQSVGSFALASSKTQVFAVALKTWLDVIASVINRHAIPRLLQLNGMDLENPPKLVFEDIETPDLEVIGKFLQTASAAGMPLFPDQELENVVRGWASLPEVSDEDIEEREREEELERQREEEQMEMQMAQLQQRGQDAPQPPQNAPQQPESVAQSP